MNLKAILIIVTGLVLVGGGAWWFMRSSNDSGSDRTGTETTDTQMRDASINELLAQNQNLMCTYDTVDEQGNNNSGTVYFADGRMSGDFTLSASGGNPIYSHVINDGQAQYFWEEGGTEGYKLSVSQAQPADETDQDEQVSNVDQDKNFEFNCQQWNVDESRFMPPTDIDFIDYTQQIEQAQEEASEALEETCSQIEDPAQRAACESAIN